MGRVMPHGVALLEGVQTDRGRGHLPGDDHHRDRIHVGRRDAGDGVRHTRAGGHERNTDVAGRARIAVGGVHRGLLMAHQHVLDGVLLVQGVVDVQNGATGIAPDVLDVLGLQAAHEDVGTVEDFAVGGGGGVGGCGALGVCGRHVHDEEEPFRISLTKNDRCPSYTITTRAGGNSSTAATDCQRARPREAVSEPARPGPVACRCGRAQARSKWRKTDIIAFPDTTSSEAARGVTPRKPVP